VIPSEGEKEGIAGFGGRATSDFTAAAKGEPLAGGAGMRYTGGNEECWVVRGRKIYKIFHARFKSPTISSCSF